MLLSAKNLLPCDGVAYYLSGFFDTKTAEAFYQRLLTEIDWQERSIKLFGKEVLQPRKVAWYGDPGLTYTYSNFTQITTPWIPLLLEIKHRIETETGFQFNSVLLNLYRNESDSMGWHSDNEKELGDQPTIASVSFGHARIFQFKHISRPIKADVLLEPGSLLIMAGATQTNWKHQLPKRRSIAGPRINLTFRTII